MNTAERAAAASEFAAKNQYRNQPLFKRATKARALRRECGGAFGEVNPIDAPEYAEGTRHIERYMTASVKAKAQQTARAKKRAGAKEE